MGGPGGGKLVPDPGASARAGAAPPGAVSSVTLPRFTSVLDLHSLYGNAALSRLASCSKDPRWPPYVLPDALARPAPPTATSFVKYEYPRLPGVDVKRPTTEVFHFPVDVTETKLTFYAVPVALVFGPLDPGRDDPSACLLPGLSPFSPAAMPTQSRKIPVALPQPPVVPPAPGPSPAPGGAAAPPQAATLPPPDLAAARPMAAEVMNTADGPLPVVGRDAEFMITTEYTKLAVGAASVSILIGPDGVRVIDAGVHLVQRELPDGTRITEPSPILIETTIRRLRQLIGDRPILEVLVSHAHLDHVGLLERLSQVFEIRALRINAAQRLPKGKKESGRSFHEYEQAVSRGQQLYRDEVEAALRARLRAEEASWRTRQAIKADAGRRAAEFDRYVEAEVAARLKVIEDTRIKVEVPTPDGVRVVEVPLLGEIPVPVHEKAPAAGKPGEPKVATVLHEDAPAAAAQKTRPRGAKLDTMESNWIIDLPNQRFLFFPDARAPDFKGLRAAFEKEIARLGRPAHFYQIWDLGHHAQSGFRSGSAAQLAEMVSFLNDFSQATTRSGGRTVDAVMVSAHKKFIDPAGIFILRSLGFEAYIAHSGEDVTYFEVTLRTGETVSGTTARPIEGIRPWELLLRRAQAAINERNGRIAELEQEFRTLSRKRTAEANTRRAEIKQEIAGLEASVQAIETPRDAYLKGIKRDVGKSPHAEPPRPLPAGEEPAAVEAVTLRAELTRQNVPERPVVGEKKLAHFEAEALVVTGLRAPRITTPEQQQVLDLQREVRDMTDALPRSETPIQSRTALIERLQKLQAASEELARKITDPEGRRLAELKIEHLKQRVAEQQVALARTPGGTTRHARGPGGELITHRMFVEKPAARAAERPAGPADTSSADPIADVKQTQGATVGVAPTSPAMQRTLQGAQLVGRGMGVLMMVTSVSGLGDSAKTPGGLDALSFAHAAFGFSLGARMAAHVSVHPGEFVVLSVLEILEAGSAANLTAEQANTAAAYGLIRNSINLGLMAFGQWMTQAGIKRANVGLVIAGQAISLATFLVDWVLEKLGVYEWLERKFAFFPEEVTQVTQDIRKLMKEYRVILGGMELQQRSQAAPASLVAFGEKSPKELGELAMANARARRPEAMAKERQLAVAFKEAYERARTSFAGLRELDAWRDEFLALQYRADGLVAGGDLMQRTYLESMFELIEKTVVLDAESEETIRKLEQWDEIRDATSALNKALDTVEAQLKSADFSGADWKKAASKEHELTQMLDNARYRLEPAAQGPYRTTRLLSPGKPARAFYEKELAAVELPAAQARGRLARAAASQKLPHGGGSYLRVGPELGKPPVVTSASMLLQQASAALAAYRTAIADTKLPAGVAPAALTISSATGALYKTHLASTFGASIARLQAGESSVRSLITMARAMVEADPRLTAEREALKRLAEEFETAFDDRKVVRMLLFPEELEQQIEEAKRSERRQLASGLGQPQGVTELSEYELAALDALSARAATVGEPESQLRQTPPGAKLFRFQGKADQNIYSGGVADVPDPATPTRPPKVATVSDDVIVALIGDAPSQGKRYWKTEMVYILPINRKAIEFFGTRGKVTIMKDGHSLTVPYQPGK
jgi:hypothetical protein